MTSAARLMLGATLLAVPTIIYGGLTLFGVLSGGQYGAPAPKNLTALQQALYRAGHAHAGVLVLLSLILQLALDYAKLEPPLVWPLRIVAPAGAILVSAGFFGVAHSAAMRLVLYAGVACVLASTIGTGIGLLCGP